MNQQGISEKKPVVMPWVASIFCILVFLLIGVISPLFRQMYIDFGLDPIPLNLRIMLHIHWLWTLPLGVLMAFGLIWSSRRWSRKTTLLVDSAAIVLTILLFGAFVVMATLPVGGLQTIN